VRAGDVVLALGNPHQPGTAARLGPGGRPGPRRGAGRPGQRGAGRQPRRQGGPPAKGRDHRDERRARAGCQQPPQPRPTGSRCERPPISARPWGPPAAGRRSCCSTGGAPACP
jgi:hypothetical protein